MEIKRFRYLRSSGIIQRMKNRRFALFCIKWLPLFAGMAVLLSFLFFLLPFWVTYDEFQSQIPLPFLRILLGGSFLFGSNGLESSFYFRSNLPLFFTLQFLVLGAICSLLSYGNWKIITLSICLLGLGIIGITLSPLFIFWINPSVPVSSLRFGYGFYLWLAVLLLLVASLLVLAVFLKGKSKGKVTKN